MDGDDDRCGGLAFSGLCVGVEVSGGEDSNVLRVKDRFRKAGDEFVQVLREEGNGDGVNGELDFVVGEAEGQPRRLPHREGFVKLGGESVETGCEGGSRGGRVGDKEGDRSAIIDLGRDREGKGADRIPKEAGSNVGKVAAIRDAYWCSEGGERGA